MYKRQFQLNSPFGIIMAHNGNVANYRDLRDVLYREHHRLLNSDCDVEIILNLFAESLARERTRSLEARHIFRAVEAVFKKVRGSYSVVAYIADQGLVAFRDPYGIKPPSMASGATASCPPTPSPRKRSA